MSLPTASFDTSQPSFSLNGAWVATNNLNGTFGTPVALFAKGITLDNKSVSDQAQANSQIVATEAMQISVDWTLDTAGISFPALQVITGLTPASSPTFTTLPMSNFFYPYFGLIIEALGDGGTAFRILFPKSKVMTGFSWRFEFGKIVVPQFKGMSIYDGNLGYMIDPREYPSAATAVSFPPGW